MTGCRIHKFGIFTISWLGSVCMNVKIRNKFIEIKYSVSNGLVIFITNYWWFRILEISRYRWSNGCWCSELFWGCWPARGFYYKLGIRAFLGVEGAPWEVVQNPGLASKLVFRAVLGDGGRLTGRGPEPLFLYYYNYIFIYVKFQFSFWSHLFSNRYKVRKQNFSLKCNYSETSNNFWLQIKRYKLLNMYFSGQTWLFWNWI